MRVASLITLFVAIGATTLAAHEPSGRADARVFSAWDQSVLAGLLLLAMLYLIGWGRLRGRTGARSSLEPWCFAAGWCALVLSILPWVDAAALERFSAHMAQHELMMLIAAPLLMAGRPLAVCLWALPGRWRHRAAAPLQHSWTSGVFALLTAPACAWILHGLTVWVWHAPPLYDLAISQESVHAVQHAMFVATSMLFWFGLLHGRYGRAGYGAAVFYVFTTAVHTGVLGALFLIARTPLYSSYAAPAVGGIEPLGDQQLAGLVMWIPGGLLLTITGLALFAAWLGAAERRAGRHDRNSAATESTVPISRGI